MNTLGVNLHSTPPSATTWSGHKTDLHSIGVFAVIWKHFGSEFGNRDAEPVYAKKELAPCRFQPEILKTTLRKKHSTTYVVRLSTRPARKGAGKAQARFVLSSFQAKTRSCGYDCSYEGEAAVSCVVYQVPVRFMMVFVWRTGVVKTVYPLSPCQACPP